MEITDIERLILINQFNILEQMNPQDPYFKNGREILENGYRNLYSEITDILSDEMSEQDGDFVIDVLQMYRSLNDSYIKIKDKENVSEEDLNFPGFDGNQEGKFYLFTKFYIQDFGRYAEFSDGKHGEFNSHSRMIPKYRRMLAEWREQAGRYESELTIEQIKRIINA